MLLLDATAILAVSLARSLARDEQAAQLRSIAWSIATRSDEQAIACVNSPPTIARRTQLTLEWRVSVEPRWEAREAVATLRFSPLAGGGVNVLRWRSAAACP